MNILCVDVIYIKKSSVIKILGVIISIALMIFLFKDINLSEFAGSFANADKTLLLTAGAVYLANYILRSLRWMFILKSIKILKVRTLLPTILASYSANNILPLRAGEIVRAVHGRKKTGIPAARLFSTVIVERIIDVLMLLVLLAVSVLLNPLILSKIDFGTSFAVICASLTIIIVCAVTAAVYKDKLAEFVPGRLKPLFIQLTEGLKCISSAENLFYTVLVSSAIWFAENITVYLVYRGFNIGIDMMQSLLMLVVINLMITIPSTPGFIGIVESACVLVLSAYGMSGPEVLAAAVGLHLIQFVPVTILGLIILIKDGVNLSNVKDTGSRTNLQ